MGFRKSQYDVEEKGLNPKKPHANLGSDGRLLPAEENLNTPTAAPSLEKASLGRDAKVEAVPEANKTAAKTPRPADKAIKKVQDKPQVADEELPDGPKAKKESPTNNKVSKTNKPTPKAKAKKTTAKKSTTSSTSKAKTTRKKA